MKLIVRVFALAVVVAGFAAASQSKATPKMISHQAASARPMCSCVPYNCPPNPDFAARTLAYSEVKN